MIKVKSNFSLYPTPSLPAPRLPSLEASDVTGSVMVTFQGHLSQSTRWVVLFENTQHQLIIFNSCMELNYFVSYSLMDEHGVASSLCPTDNTSGS